MIITHKLKWNACLSHQIWPMIEKGWKDEDKPIHFFWGLAGTNIPEIRKCMENGEEWWYVDVGYLTKPITRYPVPSIDHKDTYFRICKGSIHTNRGQVLDGARLQKLGQLGIDTEFKGWETGDEIRGHILICPSSPTVTHHINGIDQNEWVRQVKEEIRKHSDREIVFRNKPRPGNEWWETDIADELKGAHCLVTNMSLSAIDAVLNKTPIITHGMNVASPIAGRDLSKIEKPLRPGRKTVEEWMKFLANNQFTLEEMADGTAYNILREQDD